MSYARGLFTPVLVALIGVGTGKRGYCSTRLSASPADPMSRNCNIRPSFQATKRAEGSRTVCLVQPQANTVGVIPTSFTGLSNSKNITSLRQKSRFARRRRLSQMLVELLQSLKIREDGLRCKRVNSVSRRIPLTGLRFRSTNTILQRSRHDIAYRQYNCRSRCREQLPSFW